ncbi:MAG: alpha/beta fold hydrolase [Desulfuromonadaceae bacterium]|nr:alpha/beta fold hydrolase [Desulfuromonadaceae bacterium]
MMNWLIIYIQVVAAGVAIPVVVSFALAWYEAANADPRLLDERFSPQRLWLAVMLMVQEYLCLLICVLSQPIGWFRPLNPASRPYRETPVILLHGLFQNHACWLWARLWLRLCGFKSVHVINLPPWRDIETLTEQVSRKVDRLRLSHDVDKVHLVGHSMGGIIARNYIRLRGGSSRVARCVLLGAPNSGSRMIPFAVTRLARTIMPGSTFLQRLNQSPPAAETVVTNIYSQHDNLVLPPTNARLATATEVPLVGVGHNTLLFHPRALNAVVAALRGQTPTG